MTMIRLLAALPFTLCCWLGLPGCSRVSEPLGHADGGVEDGGGEDGGDRGDPGRAGASSPGGSGATGNAGHSGAMALPAGYGGGLPTEPWPRGGNGAAGYGGGIFGSGGIFGGGGFGGGVGGQPPLPVGGWGGYGAAGHFWVGSGGSCGCDDGDICTDDYCSPTGCLHQTRVTEEVDADGDGFYRGCDCDDTNSDVKPGQTLYFSEPNREIDGEMPPPFDYNCDWVADPRFVAMSSGCERHPDADACFGEGWLDLRWAPDCGRAADYQICEFKDGTCTPRVVAMVQRCR